MVERGREPKGLQTSVTIDQEFTVATERDADAPQEFTAQRVSEPHQAVAEVSEHLWEYVYLKYVRRCV